MIVVMKAGAPKEEVDAVCALIRAEGLETFVSEGQERTIIGVVGIDIDRVAHVGTMPGVEQAIRVTAPHKLASLEHQRDRTRITVKGIPIGAGAPLVVMAGPARVESPEMLFETAALVKREGANVLRGGAYKPRTSPYAFQGLGEEGLKLLAEARAKTGLPIVTEMTDASQMELFEEYVDIIQIGSRNMHNFTLLRAAGQGRTPVLLKRGFGATIDEWLMAAEYVLSAGNANVILCERGIRTFERATRNTLDLSAVPVLARDDPPASRRRSIARHGQALPRRLDEPWCGRRWCRRLDHRGPSRSATRALGRRPVAVVPGVRGADGRDASPGVPEARIVQSVASSGRDSAERRGDAPAHR